MSTVFRRGTRWGISSKMPSLSAVNADQLESFLPINFIGSSKANEIIPPLRGLVQLCSALCTSRHVMGR